MDKETDAIVAVVDDDDDVSDVLRGLLEIMGYQVVTFPTGQELLDDPRLSDVACLVVDQNMPGMTGIQLLRQLKAMGNTTPSLLITGAHDEAVAREALDAGVMRVLTKPMESSELLRFIRFAVG